MRRIVGLAAAAAVLVGSAPLAYARAARADTQRDPLDEARRAAEQTSFSGSATLQWRDASNLRTEQLTVKGAHGTVLAQGERSAMAVGAERLIYSPGAGWEELWPAGLGSAGNVQLDDAYDVRAAGTDHVAGYATDVLEVLKAGVVRERLDLEAATRLLLRRRQYDSAGNLFRAFEFDQIQIGNASVTAPATPAAPKQNVPRPLSWSAVPASERQPQRLSAGYQRLGAYRQGSVVQLVYSDGLYDLSLFQEEGGLDSGDLPAQRQATRVDSRPAWGFSWPGGEGIVWTAGRTVYTLVGDVPADELTAVAGSVSEHPSTSVMHRLRQACRGAVESFRGIF